MAEKKTNPLKLDSNTLKKLFKDSGEVRTPSLSVGGAGVPTTMMDFSVGGSRIPSTGGRGTVSQAYNDYLASIDWKKRTPLENTLEFGINGLTGTGEEIGREKQKKAIEQIKMEAVASKSETPTQEEEAQTIAVSNPKKQSAQKLYRVMYAGKGADASEVYETKEEADAALRNAGGRGAVAGVNMSQKSRGEEMLPVEDVEERKKRYMNQLSKTKETPKKESDRLKKIQALRNPQTEEEILQVAENRGRMEEGIAKANEEKRVKDKAEGAKFAGWLSNVKAGRASEGALNDYNKQLGLLKQSYSQARASGDPLAAFQINEYIQEYQSGIPKEMGARKRFAESGALRERNEMLRRKMEEARIQAERDRRLSMVNADYNR
jgi:hypothetical protein